MSLKKTNFLEGHYFAMFVITILDVRGVDVWLMLIRERDKVLSGKLYLQHVVNYLK